MNHHTSQFDNSLCLLLTEIMPVAAVFIDHLDYALVPCVNRSHSCNSNKYFMAIVEL